MLSFDFRIIFVSMDVTFNEAEAYFEETNASIQGEKIFKQEGIGLSMSSSPLISYVPSTSKEPLNSSSFRKKSPWIQHHLRTNKVRWRLDRSDLKTYTRRKKTNKTHEGLLSTLSSSIRFANYLLQIKFLSSYLYPIPQNFRNGMIILIHLWHSKGC